MRKENMFWGLFFIVSAVLLVVSQFGFFQGVDFWLIAWTILLLALLVKGIKDFSFPGIILSIAILLILYRPQLGLNMSSYSIIVAALLLSIGCSLLFKPRPKQSYYDNSFSDQKTEDAQDINIHVSFSSLVRYISTDHFNSAFIDASFAGAKVYLDNASIDDTATIEVNMNFSGLELYVPKEYHVENHVASTLAGVEEKGHPLSSTGKTILLTGRMSFAGITVIYI